MAGESHFGSNGSVWWTTTHERGPRPGQFKRRGPSACKDANVDLKNDHWVDIDSRSEVQGHDPDAADRFTVTLRFDTIATGSGAGARVASVAAGASPVMTKTSVEVSRQDDVLRSLRELIASAQAALAEIEAGQLSALVTATVPGLQRLNPPTGDFEVTVTW